MLLSIAKGSLMSFVKLISIINTSFVDSIKSGHLLSVCVMSLNFYFDSAVKAPSPKLS